MASYGEIFVTVNVAQLPLSVTFEAPTGSREYKIIGLPARDAKRNLSVIQADNSPELLLSGDGQPDNSVPHRITTVIELAPGTLTETMNIDYQNINTLVRNHRNYLHAATELRVGKGAEADILPIALLHVTSQALSLRVARLDIDIYSTGWKDASGTPLPGEGLF